MSSLLLDSLDVVLAQAPPALVPPERVPALREVASRLPPIMPGGLELRLGTGGPVDFQQNIAARDGLPGIAARHIAALLAGEAPAWDRIARFCAAWVDPTTPWREEVRDIWLGFDLPASPRTLPVPAVFVGLAGDGLSRDKARAVVEPALASLLPDLMPAVLGTIRRCVERLLPLLDRVTLALDVGSAVGPRLGLECAIHGQPRRQPRWAAFVDEMVELGCCTPPERDALLSWPRTIIRFSGIAVGLNHVTLDIIDAAALRARASVYFRPGSLEGDGDAGTIDASAENRPTVRTAPRSWQRSGAIDDAIEGALDFLLSNRAQSGLWRDFATNTGGSDDWVSCVVGAILAEDPRPRAHREASATWQILTARASPSGGWGWSVVAPPDADSTAWGLRLAHGVGAGDTEPARRARQFLQRHSSPSGGLRTYLAEAFPGRPRKPSRAGRHR